MARGKALIVGVGEVDAEQYRGWSGPLSCTENDANAIAAVASERGFENTLLLTRDATKEAVKNTITLAAEELEAGDIFFMYYSGHGNTARDKSGDESDGKDETLCLYDNQMLDDELNALWPKFLPGVRVLVIADCCHSGSMTRNAVNDDLVARAMDEQVSNKLLAREPDRYQKMRDALPDREEIRTTVKLMSGCQDHQLSYESKSTGHGLMTAALLKVLGSTTGSYADVHAKILAEMPETQQPNLLTIGVDNPAFDAESPITI